MCDVGGCSELSGVEVLGWCVDRVNSAHEEGRALGGGDKCNYSAHNLVAVNSNEGTPEG